MKMIKSLFPFCLFSNKEYLKLSTSHISLKGMFLPAKYPHFDLVLLENIVGGALGTPEKGSGCEILDFLNSLRQQILLFGPKKPD